MIVSCPNCSARFQYGDARFQGARSKRFKCPKCAHVFEVLNPAMIAAPVLPAPAPPAATDTTARTDREAMLSLAGMDEPLPPGIRFSLAFLTGPLSSTVRILAKPITVIGREEGDVVINDPETSRRHARIEIHQDGTAWLADLDSTNGTFIAGNRITGTTQLVDRQEFSCGRSTFMLLIRPIDSMSLD
jgi:predicted Zn finger-like uncharacterized protein